MSGPVVGATPARVSSPTDAAKSPRRAAGRAPGVKHLRESPMESHERNRKHRATAEDKRQAKIRERVAPTLPTVTVDGDTVTITTTLDFAGVIGAALLDRALALEPNRYQANSAPMTDVPTQERIAWLRGAHKALRAARTT